MNTYNTGNALGSTDPRDLLDNASNLDDAMNSTLPTWTDRLGVTRDTYAGQEDQFDTAQTGRAAEFDSAQAARETDFQAFLVASGWIPLGNYAGGIPVGAYNEYVAYDGSFWRPIAGSVPFVTSGTWVGDDENKFTLLDPDDVLRQDLDDDTDPAKGAGIPKFNQALSYPPSSVGFAVSALAKAVKYVTPQQYGAVADGTSHPLSEFYATLAEAQAVYPHALALTDEIDWAAFQSALNAGVSRIYAPAGHYVLNRGNTRTTNITLFGDGYDSHLDYSGHNSSDGLLISGAITQINDLADDIVKGARSLSFSGTPSLVTGDVVCLYNPTNGTWLSDRTVYRAGEYFRVHTLAADIATVYGESTDAYLAADVEVYRLDGVQVTIENIRATPASTAQYAPVKVLHGNGVRIRNYWGSPNGTYTGLSVERSYDVDFVGVTSVNASESINNEYGFVIANCQNVTATGGSTVATRHAISIGGTDAACCVPNRNVLIHGMTLENINLAADIGAGDMHGNCDNVTYDNCIFRNGAIMQGRNVTIRNSTIYGVSSTDGVCIYGTEVKGGVFTIESNRFITQGDAAAVGAVHISPSTTQTERLTIVARNNTFEIPNAAFNSKPFFIRGRGVTSPINIIVDGIHLMAPVAVFAFVYADDNVLAALNSEMIVVDNVTGPAGTYLLYPAGDIAAVPTRQMRQSGSVTITSTAATLNTAPTQSFRYPYSKVPTHRSASVSGVGGAAFSLLGGQIPIPGIYEVTTTGIRPSVQAVAAFTAGSDASLQWTAAVQEV